MLTIKYLLPALLMATTAFAHVGDTEEQLRKRIGGELVIEGDYPRRGDA